MPNQDDKWSQYEDKGGGDKWEQFAAPAEKGPSTYEKLTSGYNPDVEEFAQKHPVLGPVVRFLDAAGGAAMSTPEGIYKALSSPTETAKGALQSIAAWKDPNVRAGAMSVLPEALGAGVGSVAGGEAAGAVVPKIPKVTKGVVSKTLRNETGALRPITKVGAKVAGAAVGHATGIPEAGLVGYLTGPEILESIVPKREPTVAPAVPVSRGPGRYTGPSSVPKPPPPPPIPKPVPPSPFAGMTSTTAPVGSAELPPVTGAQTPFPVIARKGSMAPPPSPETGGPLDIQGSPQDLVRRPKKLVIPGEEPSAADLKRAGDATQWSDVKLRQLAKFGDKIAENELRRRAKLGL